MNIPTVIVMIVIVTLATLALTVFGGPSVSRLPGTLQFRVGNSIMAIPVLACILISIVLSILFSLFGQR